MSPNTSKTLSKRNPVFLNRDPMSLLKSEVENLFGKFQLSLNGNFELITPSVDVSESDQQYEVRIDVPGFRPDQIEIEMSDNCLHVHGKQETKKEEKGKTFHCVERQTGSFSRTIPLPGPVRDKGVVAECENGVLTVVIPKSEMTQKQKIKVKAK